MARLKTSCLPQSLQKDSTIIENAAQDPEISNLADFINAIGGKVTGAGTYTITIDGVTQDELAWLRSRDTIPDRCEAGTFIYAVCATGGEITMEGANPHHLYSVINKASEMGAEVSIFAPDTIKIKVDKRMKAVDVDHRSVSWFPNRLASAAHVGTCDS